MKHFNLSVNKLILVKTFEFTRHLIGRVVIYLFIKALLPFLGFPLMRNNEITFAYGVCLLNNQDTVLYWESPFK